MICPFSMKRTAPLIIMSAALALGACTATTEQWLDPDKTFAKLDQPDVDTVEQTLEKQAQAAMEKGDIHRAGQFYEQLLGSKKTKPEDKIRYKIGWAECLRRMGENEKALDAFDAILKEDPKNIDAQEGRGLTLMQLGKTADAGRAFEKIMKTDKKRWRTLNALGILFVNKNMIPEAMAYYKESLKESEDNPAVVNNVGLSHAVDGKYARAINALELAARLSKSEQQRKQINLNLAMVYGVSGDMDTAKQIASKHLEGPALDNNLGLYAHLAKNDKLARTYLNMALSHSPTFYERAWENLDALGGKGSD